MIKLNAFYIDCLNLDDASIAIIINKSIIAGAEPMMGVEGVHNGDERFTLDNKLNSRYWGVEDEGCTYCDYIVSEFGEGALCICFEELEQHLQMTT